jgi:hypothetical protein
MHRTLLDLIGSDNVESVTGWPMGRISGVFLNIVISANAKVVNVSGQAVDVEPRTEAFIPERGGRRAELANCDRRPESS